MRYCKIMLYSICMVLQYIENHCSMNYTYNRNILLIEIFKISSSMINKNCLQGMSLELLTY